MFQNILFGYSETLAGDTPGPGKGRKASAEAETCGLANMPAAWLFTGTACVSFSIHRPIPALDTSIFSRVGIRIHCKNFSRFLLLLH